MSINSLLTNQPVLNALTEIINAGAGNVTAVTGVAPVSVTAGATPAVSLAAVVPALPLTALTFGVASGNVTGFTLDAFGRVIAVTRVP